MKAQKIITIITIILLVAIISIVSFLGIYKKEEYRVTNVVLGYNLGMEFTNRRVVNLEVEKEEAGQTEETEETIEIDEIQEIEEAESEKQNFTQDDYKKAMKVIKNRLKGLGVDEYRVVLDTTNGNVQIRIPENDETDKIMYNVLQSGTFELKDSETGEILIGTNSVKRVNVVYGQVDTETGVYLQFEFNKEGKEKLQEISKIYVKTETEEETKNDEETEQNDETAEEKTVEVFLNGQSIRKTYFGSEIPNGILNIVIGTGTDSDTLEQYAKAAREEAVILNSGLLNIDYTQTSDVEESNITNKQINISIYVAIAVLCLMIIYYIIRIRTKGLLASILQIGYIALLLLTLRYTNVKITISGIFGIVIGIVLNYIYIYISFKNTNLNFIKDVTSKFALKLIPVYVIAVVLSFNNLANVYSLGMTLVWSVIIMYLYNLSLTQIALNTIKNSNTKK